MKRFTTARLHIDNNIVNNSQERCHENVGADDKKFDLKASYKLYPLPRVLLAFILRIELNKPLRRSRLLFPYLEK